MSILRAAIKQRIIQLYRAGGSYLLLWHLRERLSPDLTELNFEYPPSFRSVSLLRGFVFLLKFLPTPVRLSADAALSLPL